MVQDKSQTTVLVVGSVLLDVIFLQIDEKEFLDTNAFVPSISIGGAAYNTSANLKAMGGRPLLFSALRQDSPISDILVAKVRKTSIEEGGWQFDDNIPEAIFVASERFDKSLRFALTSAPIAQTAIQKAELFSAATASSSIVVDCSVNLESLINIRELAHELNQPLIINTVSDSLANGVANLARSSSTSSPHVVVCGNEKEISSLLRPTALADINSKEKICQLCRKLGAEIVIVTSGVNGHSVYESNGNFSKFAAPKIDHRDIKSAIGAGDCFIGALSLIASVGTPINWDKFFDLFTPQLRSVLNSEGATATASLSHT